MRISRKVMALAAVAVLACTGVAFAAIQHWQFKDGNGNVVQTSSSSTFGENFAVKDDGDGITLNVAGGAATNTCHFQVTGQVVANDPNNTLKANIPGHVFYGCDHARVYAQGVWSMTVGQASNPLVVRLNSADVQLRLGASSTCEFKGNSFANGGPRITLTNGGDVSNGGAPTTGALTGTLSVVSSPYTVNCPFPAGTPGTATGNVVISAASNATDNLTVNH